MIGVVRDKEGVLYTIIAPGGHRILGAIEVVARKLGVELWITSACDGVHSGPNDPHHRGEAYDIRTHDFDERFKPILLNALQAMLPAELFYVFIESPGTPNEHIHAQTKKGTVYPPV